VPFRCSSRPYRRSRGTHANVQLLHVKNLGRKLDPTSSTRCTISISHKRDRFRPTAIGANHLPTPAHSFKSINLIHLVDLSPDDTKLNRRLRCLRLSPNLSPYSPMKCDKPNNRLSGDLAWSCTTAIGAPFPDCAGPQTPWTTVTMCDETVTKRCRATHTYEREQRPHALKHCRDDGAISRF
jgi:hypothetical protein